LRTIRNLFPGGRKKALTLSYDDGITQDKKMMGIFNKYGLKTTINLNSGLQTEDSYWVKNDTTIRRLNIDEVEDLYRGHEVAVHTLSHPHLEDLPREMIMKEVIEDRRKLENVFGYPVRGMAYPFGTYNQKVIDVLKSCGIEYSRTVKQHETFCLPEKYLEWHPTCHHNNPRLEELTKEFLQSQSSTMTLMYVWGHSYEFDLDDNWELLEKFCRMVGHHDFIWYATNIEIVDYLKALDNLKYSADCSMVYNPSAMSLWISIDDKITEIKPGTTVQFS